MRFRRRILRAAKAGLVLALCLGAQPAAAQFYSLEGRFQCLDKPGAVCFDATSDQSAPSAAGRPVIRAAATPPSALRRREPPASKAEPRPADPLAAIIARLEARKPAPGDIATLESRARQSDERAIELLAWANLKGIGVPPDPTEAYLLYGMAARLGVANARRNQDVVYETMMTSHQRQQALMIEDEVLTPPPR